MLDALLPGIGRRRCSHDARHMSGEHDAALAGTSRDREIRLRVELRMDLDEVDAECNERVDADACLGRIARVEVRDGHVTALEVRTRSDDPWPDERPARDLR